MLFRASPAFLVTLLAASVCARSISSTERRWEILNVNIYTGTDTTGTTNFHSTIRFNQDPVNFTQCVPLPDGIKAVVVTNPDSNTTSCTAFQDAGCTGYGIAFWNKADSFPVPLTAAEGTSFGSIRCAWYAHQ